MAHIVPIEDEDGNLVDIEVYCTDSCAQESTNYEGWYGCQEISTSTLCESCGDMVEGLDE